MMQELWIKYKKYIMYLIVGGCTTLVNLIIFTISRSNDIALISSNALAFIGAVIFAYITNRKWVFCTTKKQGLQEKFREFSSFFFMRVISFIIETILLVISVRVINTEILNKIIISILIIIINYIISNKYIFTNPRA